MTRPLARVQVLYLAVFAAVLLLLLVWKSADVGTTPYWSYLDLRWSGDPEEQLSLLAILSRALERIETQPLLDYNDGLKYNEQTCAGRGIQSNPDQVKGEVDFWRSLTAAQIQEKRRDLTKGIGQAFGLPDSLWSNSSHTMDAEMWGAGRGIVYTGGNSVRSERA